MKILQIIDSLHLGGAERMAVNISIALCDNDIQNVLVCSRKSGELLHLLPKKTTFYQLGKKNFADVIAFFRLYKIIKQEAPDVVHAHSSSVNWCIFIKLLMPRMKLIWHDHNGNNLLLKDSDRKFIRFFSSKINAVIAVNELLLNWANKNLKTEANVFIRNFPILNFQDKRRKQKKNIILHLANLKPHKDHFAMVESVKILKQKTTIPFQVWCAGIDLHDNYSNLLKVKIKEDKLEETIKILGAVSNTEKLLSNADIGILSSESEGLPVSLLEYGLAGLPVVVTDVGQCGEVIGYGKFGKLVKAKSPELFADSILFYLNNPVEAFNTSLEFNKHIELEYGPKKFIRMYINLISSIN